MNKTKGLLFSLLLVIISVSIAAAAAEIILRLKNSSMTTYDIEMWRYSNELKGRVGDPDLGFDHVKDKSALFQNVLIRLNGMGLRGATLQKAAPDERRILFLGGSITLGWGVPEDETVAARLEQMLRQQGEQASVLNGGVGNYNTVRYVSRFFRELTPVQPTDIVVNYFLRDAEDLQ